MCFMHSNIDSLKNKSPMSGYYILTEAKERTTTLGKTFVTGKLSDASGTIGFVMWDDCPFTEEDTGKIVHVGGVVDKYRDELQAKLMCVRVAADYEVKALDKSVLVPVAPIDIGEAYFYIADKLFDVIESPYADVAMDIFLDNATEIQYYPAAKSVHHAFIGGWIMHVSNMLKMAEHICDQYEDIYPIDRALLYSGVILHDIGKIREFDLNELGVVKDYSVDGKLIGHSALGAMMVEEKAKELGLPESEMTVLKHLVLSHHGKAEFGATVEPMCIEAQILTYLDGLDSRIEIYRCALEKTEKGKFSDVVRALNKQVYCA